MAANSLHDLALEAEKNLEALATGLGQAGADPNTVKAVSKMADVTRQIVKALGAGQEQTGDNEGPAEQAAPSEQPEPQQHTIGSATASLHQAMQQSAAGHH